MSVKPKRKYNGYPMLLNVKINIFEQQKNKNITHEKEHWTRYLL